MNLNPQQLEAVHYPKGPLLVLAGAGSGKTRVIVQRIAHLINEQQVPPHQILAVTFTNKAADEMKERLRGLLDRGVTSVWVSTFHSACLRILRQHIGELGYQKDFVVYDDNDQMTLVKQCLEFLKINEKLLHPRAAQSRIDGAKNALISAEEYSGLASDIFERKVAEVYQLYQKRLKENNALDFGDLIFKTVELLQKSNRIRNYFQQLFRHILIDEYQDTNRSQYELVRLLSAGCESLCVVGDEDQSIYRWRGADINNILNFEKDYPGTKIIPLEQNYRSTQTVLALASKVIENNKERKGKTLWTKNNKGERGILFTASDEREEARFVISELKELTEQGFKYSDCAVFYRTNAQSRTFEDELNRFRIPYTIYGGMKFYERMEIKDILSYLRVLINPADSLTLKRIINVPARGIGKKLLEGLESFSEQKGCSLYETLSRCREIEGDSPKGLNKGMKEKAAQVYALLESFRKELPHLSPVNLTKMVIEKSGYREELVRQKTMEAENRLENLEELLNVLGDYEKESEAPSLSGFLDQIALAGDTDNYDPAKGVLPMMTLHLAKGLEFPVVFIVGMEEGLFPHQRSLDEPEELEEERRLCYVGLTRARQKIYLTHALKRRLYGGDQYNLPSRFLEEMPEELVERVDGGWRDSESLGRVLSVDDFDQRPETERSPKSIYKIGISVKHPIFGEGVVKRREGKAGQEKITVYFRDGRVKTLMVKYAGLTVL
ncbi:MAG: UvrD-helicase domain-containing protein [Deltaproteobacteria bacterium]|nr:UvrD-helicase domain-containing protein [Deltaproteobacteria bacterium]